MKEDRAFNKLLDLEPEEWREASRPEPFWGFNAKPLLMLFLVGMAASVVMTKLVTGATPYWFLPLLESLGLDGWAKLGW